MVWSQRTYAEDVGLEDGGSFGLTGLHIVSRNQADADQNAPAINKNPNLNLTPS